MSNVNSAELKTILEHIFIKPVRSVLLIDDEYPTLDSMLAGHVHDEDVWSKVSAVAKKNSNRLSDIIAFCRKPERAWLVDVHDGQNVTFNSEEDNTVAHLHQCDLLFLDYHLDGDYADSKKCHGILRHLAESAHFNLVVIVTKEDELKTFTSIVREFTKPIFADAISLGEDVLKVIEIWEDDDADIKSKLVNSISFSNYLELIKFKDQLKLANVKVSQYLNDFMALLASKPQAVKCENDEILKWTILEAEKEFDLTAKVSPQASSINSSTKWLCSQNLFVTVCDKKESKLGEEILSRLINALVDWHPSPNRLLLSAFRSEIESRGLSLDDQISHGKYMQALWLKNLTSMDESEKLSEIDQTIRRYGEALTTAISHPIRTLLEKAAKLESTDANLIKVRLSNIFGTTLTKDEDVAKASIEHNIAISNIPINGWHLAPGHILKIDQDYWVCLTPACDLVPKKPSARQKNYHPAMPFKAVKLTVGVESTALKDASSTRSIFIHLEGENRCFHFNPENLEKTAPIWIEIFAKNGGKIDASNTLEVAVVNICEQYNFTASWVKAEIVAQLRYEYAINLMQRLNANLMRVGLDYVSHPKSV